MMSNLRRQSSLPPLLKRRQRRGPILLSALIILKPIVGNLVHPGIPSRVVAESMQPSLSMGEAKFLAVEPGNGSQASGTPARSGARGGTRSTSSRNPGHGSSRRAFMPCDTPPSVSTIKRTQKAKARHSM
jgi:hypothetical protein